LASVPVRSLLRFWLPPLLWTGVIFTASTDFFSGAHTGPWLTELIRWITGHALPSREFGTLHLLVRKAGHLTEYGVLGALLFRAIRGDREERWSWNWALIAVLAAAAIGASDEWHQTLVPSRGPSPWDVVIDTAGASLAQVIIRTAQVLFFKT